MSRVCQSGSGNESNRRVWPVLLWKRKHRPAIGQCQSMAMQPSAQTSHKASEMGGNLVELSKDLAMLAVSRTNEPRPRLD